ncbi:MAG: hypothetical protein KJ000_20205 [Pirellulaceae bacterium]|nr:hypothetical protein [Pirellulaceae bacterium]
MYRSMASGLSAARRSAALLAFLGVPAPAAAEAAKPNILVILTGEIHSRGGGAQHPSAVIHDGTLYVQHSMGKEDIWISSIPLSQPRLAP